MKDIVFQIPKFDDNDDQPRLDRSISEDTKYMQFKYYTDYKYSFLSKIFRPNSFENFTSKVTNQNNKERIPKEGIFDGIRSFLSPSSQSIITPLNVMKASESQSQQSTVIQESTTFEINAPSSSSINTLASKPLDDILDGDNVNRSTSIELKDDFHFRSRVDLQVQGTKTSSMSVVHTEKTVNENCLKFYTGIDMLKNITSLEVSPSSSKDSPFSKEIFSKIQDVTEMMFTKEFISITKKESSKWETLKPLILKLIISFKKSEKEFVSSERDFAPKEVIDEDSPELIIREILKDKIRPVLLSNGADVELVEFDGSDLTLRLLGSYKNFPSVQDSLEKLVLESSSVWVPVKNLLFV
eukprot:TRINITY_DN2688_c0_g1_i1.p1 TRINITY_DN2688_c0_g1~~TRINITY_DN2688_c0_g1_i1.p1  ORF type:complete len:355 (+),score=103.57 TRINITY_DN2688_c0_g1_i1:14-1078(+)